MNILAWGIDVSTGFFFLGGGFVGFVVVFFGGGFPLLWLDIGDFPTLEFFFLILFLPNLL